MAEAGADRVVARAGSTTNGSIGATTATTLEESDQGSGAMRHRQLRCPDAIKICHGGPISMPDRAFEIP